MISLTSTTAKSVLCRPFSEGESRQKLHALSKVKHTELLNVAARMHSYTAAAQLDSCSGSYNQCIIVGPSLSALQTSYQDPVPLTCTPLSRSSVGDPTGWGGEPHAPGPCYELDYTPVISYIGIWTNLKGLEAQKLSSGFPMSPSRHT